MKHSYVADDDVHRSGTTYYHTGHSVKCQTGEDIPSGLALNGCRIRSPYGV